MTEHSGKIVIPNVLFPDLGLAEVKERNEFFSRLMKEPKSKPSNKGDIELALQKMHFIAKQHQLILPENLIDRVAVLDSKDIEHERSRGSMGFCNEQRVAVILYDRNVEEVEKENYGIISQCIQIENHILSTAIHELWHSTSYMEMSPHDHTHRAGLVDSSLGENETMGGNVLNEGLTVFLTDMTLDSMNKSLTTDYPDYRSITASLIRKIGLDPLIQAYLTSTGLNSLQSSINAYFKNDTAYKMLLSQLGYYARFGQREFIGEKEPLFFNTSVALTTANFEDLRR